ncbi:MAG: type II secretion system protein [Candidatus Paceibacterota bacterium]|jgi:type IV pilus assembly protein PilA
MQNKKGFTLIELLVVIAIIGILTSVVLASLNSARSKGGDAGVKDNLASIRTQAEVYYDGPKNYGTAFAPALCSTAGAGTMFVDDSSVKNAIASAASSGGGTVNCASVTSPAAAWAISAQLKADTTKYWCVDSTGNATSTSTALPTTGAVCQ